MKVKVAYVIIYLLGALRMNSFFFSSVSLLFGCSFVLFQLSETVPRKSTNFEFIGRCLHRVHQVKRNAYRLIDIGVQIKAKFIISLKNLGQKKQSL